jgi:hypothetical protein
LIDWQLEEIATYIVNLKGVPYFGIPLTPDLRFGENVICKGLERFRLVGGTRFLLNESSVSLNSIL